MPPYVVRVSTCSLNQWALDFEGNYRRVSASIAQARAEGSRFRTGPELELTGYGCEDHFYESDTEYHAWASLGRLMEDGSSDDLLIDVGMPLTHQGVRYNARVFCLNREILLIRPKLCLAEDGNYREGRWFTAWRESRGLETFTLPPSLRPYLSRRQATAPIGIAYLQLGDASIGAESCEELFTPGAPHVRASLAAGLDILANGSGSHHQLRKLNTRVDLMRHASAVGSLVYLYANQRGCDGGRLYYDGCALVMGAGGIPLAQGSQFALEEIQVVTAAVDLEVGRSARSAQPSAQRQGSDSAPMPAIRGAASEYFLCGGGVSGAGAGAGAGATTAAAGAASLAAAAAAAQRATPTPPTPIHYWPPEEEIGRGPACWLWDFLRRSGGGGYFLPLSGGADSAATGAIVGVMGHLVCESVGKGGVGGSAVLADLRRITGDAHFTPTSPAHVLSALFHTSYMGTAQNSSTATRSRAAALAAQLGSRHTSLNIDAVVAAVLWVFAAFVSVSGGGGGSGGSGGLLPRRLPRFASSGGTMSEDLALQNLQARIRMVLSYFFAQLLPWLGGGKGGFLLVLGSANVDESLRGYMTKYDCSSADLNPIGGISKTDLKAFLAYAARVYSYPALRSILTAPPTAELRPLDAGAAFIAAAAAGDGGGGALGGVGDFGHAEVWVEERSVVLGGRFLEASEGGGGVTAGAGASEVTTTTTTEKEEGEEEEEPQWSQTDEADMGMTYAELSWYGRLRKIHRCGPFSMYLHLVGGAGGIWEGMDVGEVARKVKLFWRSHAINRHKMTTLTPSYHAENYSPDDNRFDHRPFLYSTAFTAQFAAIDADVEARRKAAAAQ